MLPEAFPQGEIPFSTVLSRALSAAQAHHSQLSDSQLSDGQLSDGQLSLGYEALPEQGQSR